MKKIYLLLCLSLMCVSCNEESKPELSNERVSENGISLRMLDNLSLQDLGELDRISQIEAVDRLSPNRLKELWLEKMQLIIGIEENQNYIIKLTELNNFITNFDFTRDFNVEEEIYLNNFYAISTNQYGKNDIYMSINFSSFEIFNGAQNYNFFRLVLDDTAGDPNTNPGCNCRWGACDMAGAFQCKAASCNRSSAGCGWFFWQSCTELCKSQSV